MVKCTGNGVASSLARTCDVMTDLEILLATKAALLKAMRSGALIVQHGDKRVQYRSIDDLRAALAGINDEIATAEGRPRKRVFYLDVRRGY